MSVEITPELLAKWRRIAIKCQPPNWRLDQHFDVISDAHKVANCDFAEDAQHIAVADPAMVIALIDRIESLTILLFSDMPPNDALIFRAEQLDKEVQTLRAEVERLQTELKQMKGGQE